MNKIPNSRNRHDLTQGTGSIYGRAKSTITIKLLQVTFAKLQFRWMHTNPFNWIASYNSNAFQLRQLKDFSVFFFFSHSFWKQRIHDLNCKCPLILTVLRQTPLTKFGGNNEMKTLLWDESCVFPKKKTNSIIIIFPSVMFKT